MPRIPDEPHELDEPLLRLALPLAALPSPTPTELVTALDQAAALGPQGARVLRSWLQRTGLSLIIQPLASTWLVPVTGTRVRPVEHDRDYLIERTLRRALLDAAPTLPPECAGRLVAELRTEPHTEWGRALGRAWDHAATTPEGRAQLRLSLYRQSMEGLDAGLGPQLGRLHRWRERLDAVLRGDRTTAALTGRFEALASLTRHPLPDGWLGGHHRALVIDTFEALTGGEAGYDGLHGMLTYTLTQPRWAGLLEESLPALPPEGWARLLASPDPALRSLIARHLQHRSRPGAAPAASPSR